MFDTMAQVRDKLGIGPYDTVVNGRRTMINNVLVGMVTKGFLYQQTENGNKYPCSTNSPRKKVLVFYPVVKGAVMPEVKPLISPSLPPLTGRLIVVPPATTQASKFIRDLRDRVTSLDDNETRLRKQIELLTDTLSKAKNEFALVTKEIQDLREQFDPVVVQEPVKLIKNAAWLSQWIMDVATALKPNLGIGDIEANKKVMEELLAVVEIYDSNMVAHNRPITSWTLEEIKNCASVAMLRLESGYKNMHHHYKYTNTFKSEDRILVA
jgi:hypothetical protein